MPSMLFLSTLPLKSNIRNRSVESCVRVFFLSHGCTRLTRNLRIFSKRPVLFGPGAYSRGLFSLCFFFCLKRLIPMRN